MPEAILDHCAIHLLGYRKAPIGSLSPVVSELSANWTSKWYKREANGCQQLATGGYNWQRRALRLSRSSLAVVRLALGRFLLVECGTSPSKQPKHPSRSDHKLNMAAGICLVPDSGGNIEGYFQCWDDAGERHDVENDSFNCDTHYKSNFNCSCPQLSADPDIAGLGVSTSFIYTANRDLTIVGRFCVCVFCQPHTHRLRGVPDTQPRKHDQGANQRTRRRELDHQPHRQVLPQNILRSSSNASSTPGSLGELPIRRRHIFERPTAGDWLCGASRRSDWK